MNHSGDAAEQIVRISLEGAEIAAKITGSAAKEIAIFMLAALKSNEKSLKLKGPARLESMLKSGKQLETYSIKENDLKSFVEGAKDYGIVYCVIRNRKNRPDDLVDIMVKAEDAPKIARVAERFHFATVSRASIESEIIASRDENAITNARAEPELMPELVLSKELEILDENDIDKLLDDLMGPEPTLPEPALPSAEASAQEQPAQEAQPQAPETKQEANANKEAAGNRPLAKSEGRESHQSGAYSPSSKNSQKSNEKTSSTKTKSSKPSVREQLRVIEVGLSKKAKKRRKQTKKRQPSSRTLL